LNLAGADEVVTAIALYGVDLKGGFARWVGALGWCVGLVRWVGALGWRVGLDVPGSIGLDVGSVGCIRDPWQFSSTLQHLSNNFNQVLNTINTTTTFWRLRPATALEDLADPLTEWVGCSRSGVVVLVAAVGCSGWVEPVKTTRAKRVRGVSPRRRKQHFHNVRKRRSTC
jgi:hypothetical protein